MQQVTFNMNLVAIIDASKQQNNLLHDMKHDCNLSIYGQGHTCLILVETIIMLSNGLFKELLC